MKSVGLVCVCVRRFLEYPGAVSHSRMYQLCLLMDSHLPELKPGWRGGPNTDTGPLQVPHHVAPAYLPLRRRVTWRGDRRRWCHHVKNRNLCACCLLEMYPAAGSTWATASLSLTASWPCSPSSGASPDTHILSRNAELHRHPILGSDHHLTV